ncbi:MAG: hypothetical protein IPP89_00530 [Saprospiraceae bacterium]|nr:hypothetical protein [Candidatus Brachybacter algidus]MBL0117494.1 hypothetical protein [Candidatus Brachybacter algidus]
MRSGGEGNSEKAVFSTSFGAPTQLEIEIVEPYQIHGPKMWTPFEWSLVVSRCMSAIRLARGRYGQK